MDIDACKKELEARYEILAEVGQGGMGRVYRARDRKLDRIVAIKVPLPSQDDAARWEQTVTRFRREGRTLAKLHDPAIMKVYDLGEAAGFPYMASEWISGDSLQRRPRPWPAEAVRAVAVTLCAALAHAHDAGVIHRDIKPANIILRDDGAPVLIDFGIARVIDDTSMTRTGSVLGTLVYLAPELLMGGPAGPAVDQYSLGCVLYELATGRTWVQAGTLAEIVQSLLRDRPQPITELRPDFDVTTAALIHKMIERAPEGRFPSMGDALTAWSAAAGGRAAALAALGAIPAALPRATPGALPPATPSSGEVPADPERVEHTAPYDGESPPSVVRDPSARPPTQLAPPASPVAAPDTASVRTVLQSRRWGLKFWFMIAGLSVVAFFGGPRLVRMVYPPAVEDARGDVRKQFQGEVGDLPLTLLGADSSDGDTLLAAGHQAFTNGEPQRGLELYAQALSADAALATDTTLAANLVEATAAGRSRARELAEAYFSDPIRRAFQARITGPGYKERHRALAVLEAKDAVEGADLGAMARLDLKEGPRCEDREAAVLVIEEARDKRAIPDLMRLKRARGGERLKNLCLDEDVDRTLRLLQSLP